ncbi:hypothetical protein K493DRAFT_67456 [Basidiobolus meristosporus CBS 931.73]|uniref:RNA polymerase II subunit A C-terminal domain phosphatase n=1 Tax=Basidiobolus meristosporus CBS 931.73 TaxID=1314790 RepID=A0A1Y1XUV3_9FUNG|nr:hypothetical protein K493DRAFT_67456 [Basidiobolus meristosporus CBS 931.73]|eukprot:ORX89547.1 hypothetical protein K493DRAFT_67456 [Basidiobolus meristosporus CBS 931.73]
METIRDIYIPEEHLPATVISFRVSPQDEIEKYQVVCLYEHTTTDEVKAEPDPDFPKQQPEVKLVIRNVREELVSPYEGTIDKLQVTAGDRITQKDHPILSIKEPCSHGMQFNGLCAYCAKDLSVPDFGGSDTSRATINMTHDALGLRVSTEEAERLEKETSSRLLSSRKLSLIVDLDQTIIHAAVDPTIEDWMNDENNINHSATNDIAKFVLPDSPTVYYIKLRPGLREFLKEITKIYELHIYTMGTRNYASAVANVIDPDQEFFKERILSRDESGSMTQKTIQRLFPCDTSMVVIIDDRGDVWQWSPNLIKVSPYDFFVGIGDINGSFLPKQETITAKPGGRASPSSSVVKPNQKTTDKNDEEQVDETVLAQQEQEQNEIMESQKANKPLQQLQQQQQEQVEEKPILIDNDMELPMLLKVLQDIHSKYYTEYEQIGHGSALGEQGLPDVKNIIPSMKTRVLKNTNIVFSSVIPLGYDPTKSDIWCLARSFGAQCSTNLNSQVTHIVAGKPGTAKVNHGRKMPDVFIVKPEWLLDSIARWERQDERMYLIEDTPVAQSAVNPAPQSDEEIFEFGGQVIGQWGHCGGGRGATSD